MVGTTMVNTHMAIATVYSVGVAEATRISTMVAPAMGYGCGCSHTRRSYVVGAMAVSATVASATRLATL
jgi:hypothetical protein